jgi:hypothetical protein
MDRSCRFGCCGSSDGRIGRGCVSPERRSHLGWAAGADPVVLSSLRQTVSVREHQRPSPRPAGLSRRIISKQPSIELHTSTTGVLGLRLLSPREHRGDFGRDDEVILQPKSTSEAGSDLPEEQITVEPSLRIKAGLLAGNLAQICRGGGPKAGRRRCGRVLGRFSPEQVSSR